ncbi:hypothetical protein E2P81_ATG08566 [Venturia nashicola]|uniref:Uncharacterized protein n=1 Tax=Venturia nashicola TaxID=86259 RepID=A0A4Z1P408_9PEZI|nr:hypothetical protein E6O75_ATG08760 [Venturia nashicola]TLD20902.1 hypothetical protein E2P81_ATG08566 [Venturia nashicola]
MSGHCHCHRCPFRLILVSPKTSNCTRKHPYAQEDTARQTLLLAMASTSMLRMDYNLHLAKVTDEELQHALHYSMSAV